MIHDAKVEVTCDSEGCSQSVVVDLDYVYESYSDRSGRYDDNDASIEESLISKHDWTVSDGKHYCDGHEEGKEV